MILSLFAILNILLLLLILSIYVSSLNIQYFIDDFCTIPYYNLPSVNNQLIGNKNITIRNGYSYFCLVNYPLNNEFTRFSCSSNSNNSNINIQGFIFDNSDANSCDNNYNNNSYTQFLYKIEINSVSDSTLSSRNHNCIPTNIIYSNNSVESIYSFATCSDFPAGSWNLSNSNNIYSNRILSVGNTVTITGVFNLFNIDYFICSYTNLRVFGGLTVNIPSNLFTANSVTCPLIDKSLSFTLDLNSGDIFDFNLVAWNRKGNFSVPIEYNGIDITNRRFRWIIQSHWNDVSTDNSINNHTITVGNTLTFHGSFETLVISYFYCTYFYRDSFQAINDRTFTFSTNSVTCPVITAVFPRDMGLYNQNIIKISLSFYDKLKEIRSVPYGVNNNQNNFPGLVWSTGTDAVSDESPAENNNNAIIIGLSIAGGFIGFVLLLYLIRRVREIARKHENNQGNVADHYVLNQF